MGKRFVVYEIYDVVEENPKMGCLGMTIIIVLAHFIIKHFTGFSLFYLAKSLIYKILSFI